VPTCPVVTGLHGHSGHVTAALISGANGRIADKAVAWLSVETGGVGSYRICKMFGTTVRIESKVLKRI